MQFMEVFDRPLLEPFRDLDSPKIAVNLPFKLFPTDALLGTFRVFVPCAMIVGVMKKRCSGHLVD